MRCKEVDSFPKAIYFPYEKLCAYKIKTNCKWIPKIDSNASWHQHSLYIYSQIAFKYFLWTIGFFPWRLILHTWNLCVSLRPCKLAKNINKAKQTMHTDNNQKQRIRFLLSIIIRPDLPYNCFNFVVNQIVSSQAPPLVILQ